MPPTASTRSEPQTTLEVPEPNVVKRVLDLWQR